MQVRVVEEGVRLANLYNGDVSRDRNFNDKKKEKKDLLSSGSEYESDQMIYEDNSSFLVDENDIKKNGNPLSDRDLSLKKKCQS
jgi:hypothetical protein